MKIILIGATGFVGEGILMECLRDERVERGYEKWIMELKDLRMLGKT